MSIRSGDSVSSIPQVQLVGTRPVANGSCQNEQTAFNSCQVSYTAATEVDEEQFGLGDRRTESTTAEWA